MRLETLIAIGSLALTLMSTLIGGIVWLKQKQKTEIAQKLLRASEIARAEVNEQRDYAHLKRSYAQLSEAMKLVVDEIREVKQDISEIKLLLLATHKLDLDNQ